MPGMGKINRFGFYWWEHFKDAKEHGEMIISFLMGALSSAFLYMKAIGRPLPDILENELVTYFGIVAVIAAGFHLFIYRPFARHDELQEEIKQLKLNKKSLTILTAEANAVLPQAEQDAAGYLFGCRLILLNDGNLTIEDIKLEITKLTEPDGSPKLAMGCVQFPVAIPMTQFDALAYVNPGQPLEYYFMRACHLTKVYENQFVNGSLADAGTLIAFGVGKEYPITFRISAKDMDAIVLDRKLVFEGSYPAMILR